MKMTDAPAFVWVRALGGSEDDFAKDLAVDSAGYTYVAGDYKSTAALYPNETLTLPQSGNTDVFILRLDPNGAVVWTGTHRGQNHEFANAVGIHTTGTVICAGQFSFLTDFSPGVNGGELASTGDFDGYFSKLRQIPIVTSSNVTKTQFVQHRGAVLVLGASGISLGHEAVGLVTNLTSASATITNRLDVGDESLTVNVGGSGLSAAYNSATGKLQLSGTASIATYQQVLRTLTYNNVASEIDLTKRAIEVSVNDGTSSTSIVLADVNVIANAAPSASASASPTLAENR